MSQAHSEPDRFRHPAFSSIVSLFALVTALGAGTDAQAQTASGPSTGAKDGGIEQIVVTAQKRESTVQAAPLSITAISGDDLSARGTSTVEALVSDSPGLSIRTAGPGQTELEARGLSSSGGSSPTVGFYLDETPLTPPAAALNGKVVIDPDLYDLNRAEVLRGPQGTLYGSGSMGGTIKLVTNKPNFDEIQGSVDLSLSGTQGGGVNGGGSFMLNLPISDKLAMRVVGTDKYTGGWIDRIVLDPFPYPTNPCTAFAGYGCTRGNVLAAPVKQTIPNVNDSNLEGGRVEIEAKPIDRLTVDLTVLYQRITAGGYNQYEDPPGPSYPAIYQPSNLAEPISDTFRMFSGTVTYDFDFAQLTYTGAIFGREEKQMQDATENIQNLFKTPVFIPITYAENDLSRQISQELRLSSKPDSTLQWVGGAFFSDFHSTWIEFNQNPAYYNFLSANGDPDPNGIIFDANNPYFIQQYAFFGEATYPILDDVKLSMGLRYFRYRTALDYEQAGFGTATGTPAQTTGRVSSTADGFNPKFNISYTPTPDLTIYTTAAKGFRPGGVNLPVPQNICGPSEQALGLNGVPQSYGPDSDWDYEIGEKARLLDNHLQVNADFYYIKWTGVQQILTLTCGYPYTNNAGNADSFGPELEIQARIANDWSVRASGTYTSSEITKAAQGTGLSSGMPILNIPRYTGDVAITYRREAFDGVDFAATATDQYVGPFTDVSTFYENLPGYNLVNFRSGLEADHWNVYFFINNLTDKRAALTTNNTSFQWNVPTVLRISTNQPRTFGVEAQYKF